MVTRFFSFFLILSKFAVEGDSHRCRSHYFDNEAVKGGDLKAIRDKDHQGDVSSFFFFLLFSSLFFFPSQQQQHDYNLDFPVTKAL